MGQYGRVLGDVNYLTRNLREKTKEMYMIKIMEMETSYDLEGTGLDHMEAQSKINTRES